MGELSLHRMGGGTKISTTNALSQGADDIVFNVPNAPAFFALQIHGSYTYENNVIVSAIMQPDGAATGIRYSYNVVPKLVPVAGTFAYDGTRGLLRITISGLLFSSSVTYDLYYV